MSKPEILFRNIDECRGEVTRLEGIIATLTAENKGWQDARDVQVKALQRLGLLGSPVEELDRLTAENERLRAEWHDEIEQCQHAYEQRVDDMNRAEARVAALEAENERLRVQLDGTKQVRLRTEELVREVDASRARVTALEEACGLVDNLRRPPLDTPESRAFAAVRAALTPATPAPICAGGIEPTDTWRPDRAGPPEARG